MVTDTNTVRSAVALPRPLTRPRLAIPNVLAHVRDRRQVRQELLLRRRMSQLSIRCFRVDLGVTAMDEELRQRIHRFMDGGPQLIDMISRTSEYSRGTMPAEEQPEASISYVNARLAAAREVLDFYGFSL